MNEEEILEEIYEIVDNPMLKCKSKIEHIHEILEEYFGEDEDDEPDYDKITKTDISFC